MSDLTEEQNQMIVDIEKGRLDIYRADVDSAIKNREESLFYQELNKTLQVDNNNLLNQNHLINLELNLLMKVNVYNGIIQTGVFLALLLVLIIK